MVKDLYRIEYFDSEWTVRGEDGWRTYYFGNSCKDCEEWISEHNGELTEIIQEQIPSTYAEIEYEDLDDPEAIMGARFDDMNYLRYFER